jgi:hypothetical protein
VSRGVHAGIADECARGRMRVQGPCTAILTGQAREEGEEGPGRENSLASLSASLTNSLSHTRRVGVIRPVVPNYCELTTVTVFGLTTAATAMPAR